MDIFSVKALIILDDDGNRITSQFYSDDLQTKEEQEAFEKNLYTQTLKLQGSRVDVIPTKGSITLHKGFDDTHFYVTGFEEGSELVLYSVMNAFVLPISQITNEDRPTKSSIYDSMGAVLMVFDEVVDDGLILEVDPEAVYKRIMDKGIMNLDLRLGDQTLSQAFQIGRKFVAERIQRLKADMEV